MMTVSNFGLVVTFLLSAIVLSVVLKKLTLAGAIMGGLLGLSVYAGAGFTGIALLGTFFILGTVATAFKRDWKEEMGISKKSEGRRTAGQVLANGGIAGLFGVMILIFPQKASALQTALAASLASATGDTLSSELGVRYGRRFYNIWTLQKDQRGLDGVVSWEGTGIGIAGSMVIALIYAVGFGFSKNVIWIVIAGTIGNGIDSLLGATWERAHILNNNTVNFFNTFIAALVALMLVAFF